MHWPLFAWAQPATVLAGTTFDDAPLATFRLFSVDSASHLARTTGEGAALLFLLGRLWPQPATAVVGTIGEGAALFSHRQLGLGSASHCGVGHDS